MIRDNTQNVLSEVDKLIKRKLKKSALTVERSAKQLCPVKTGTLKRSILSNWYGAKGSRSIEWPENEKKGIKAGKTEIDAPVEKKAIIGTNVEYAPFVEMGTSKWPSGKPYLRPALAANADTIKEIFESE